jgi:hypothetical protein
LWDDRDKLLLLIFLSFFSEFDHTVLISVAIPDFAGQSRLSPFSCADYHLVFLDRLILLLCTEPLICSCACSGGTEEVRGGSAKMGKKGKWFSAVRKVFSSSDPDGKEGKVCQNSFS